MVKVKVKIQLLKNAGSEMYLSKNWKMVAVFAINGTKILCDLKKNKTNPADPHNREEEVSIENWWMDEWKKLFFFFFNYSTNNLYSLIVVPSEPLLEVYTFKNNNQ